MLWGQNSLKKTNFYLPRMHLKRRFFLFKGDTRKSSWNPDIPRPLCVHSSPSYRAVALCEDCWWWLPPALSSPPCSACHTYSTKPTWYKSILNSKGIDEYLALPYLIMMFYTCQYAFFFLIKLYVHVPTTLYYKHTEYGNPVLKIFMWTKCMVQNYRMNGI